MPAAPYNPRHAAPLDVRRRPLPGPVMPTTPAPAAPLIDDIRAPGIAAMFRRHPEHSRRAGVAAAGFAVMVLVASSVATAATQTHRVGLGGVGKTAPQSSLRSTKAQARAGRSAATNKGYAAVPASMVTGKHTAPATRAVISGLAANGIPNVALNAYRVAADRMAHAMPMCGIDWALLAGIGREESDHGRFGGAHLNPDGTSTPRIIGPALDGVGTAYIPAPANGLALDGDAKYTHALGPMQFIPQTWAAYGVDANGDGKADIFNINDAALAAARYLCANGGDLRTAAGQVRAILAYNHSNQYLAQVLALSAAYRNGIPVSGIPVGNIDGALPPIGQVGSYPVNPGPPTAVSTGLGSVAGSGAKQGTPSGSHPGGTSGSGSHPGAPSSAPSTGSKGGAPTGSNGSTAPKPGSSSSNPAPGGGSSSGGGNPLPLPLPTNLPTKLPTVLPSPTAPAPSPSPTSTCVLGLNGTCIVP